MSQNLVSLDMVEDVQRKVDSPDVHADLRDAQLIAQATGVSVQQALDQIQHSRQHQPPRPPTVPNTPVRRTERPADSFTITFPLKLTDELKEGAKTAAVEYLQSRKEELLEILFDGVKVEK